MALVGVRFQILNDVQYARSFNLMANESRDLSEPLTLVGKSLLGSVHDQFRTEGAAGGGSRWHALNPDYAAWKRAQVGPEPILVFTGDMRDAAVDPNAVQVTSRRLVYEIDDPKAIYHQEGEGSLPVRKIVDLPMTERRGWDRIFHSWINGLRHAPIGA